MLRALAQLAEEHTMYIHQREPSSAAADSVALAADSAALMNAAVDAAVASTYEDDSTDAE